MNRQEFNAVMAHYGAMWNKVVPESQMAAWFADIQPEAVADFTAAESWLARNAVRAPQFPELLSATRAAAARRRASEPSLSYNPSGTPDGCVALINCRQCVGVAVLEPGPWYAEDVRHKCRDAGVTCDPSTDWTVEGQKPATPPVRLPYAD